MGEPAARPPETSTEEEAATEESPEGFGARTLELLLGDPADAACVLADRLMPLDAEAAETSGVAR